MVRVKLKTILATLYATGHVTDAIFAPNTKSVRRWKRSLCLLCVPDPSVVVVTVIRLFLR